jgi:hypothetical protein
MGFGCSGVSDITNSLRFCSHPAVLTHQACVLEIDHILTLLPLWPPPRELTAALAALLVTGGQGCVCPLSVGPGCLWHFTFTMFGLLIQRRQEMEACQTGYSRQPHSQCVITRSTLSLPFLRLCFLRALWFLADLSRFEYNRPR